MKILVVSDIHANFPALKKLDQAASQADQILCLGDVVGYNAFPNECIGWLKDHDAICIRGNHDQAVLDGCTAWFNEIAADSISWTFQNLEKNSRKFLEKLPVKFEAEIEGEKILAVHGSPRDPLHEYIFPHDDLEIPRGVRVLAMGHTHIPFVRRIGKALVFNPGSVGQPRDGEAKACFAWLGLPGCRVEIERLKYPIQKTAAANKKASLPDFLSRRLFVGR